MTPNNDETFVAETLLRPRFSETDAQGVVYHAHYIVYFEVGRTDYIRQREGTSYAAMAAQGYHLAVTDINVRYHRPAVYDQELRLLTRLTEVKSRSLTFAYELQDAGDATRLVTGTTRLICVNGAGKAIQLPEQWRKWQGET